MVALLVVIFSVGLRVRMPSLGESFAVYYATGIVAFFMYQNVVQKVSKSIRFSRQLLAYPRVTWVDAILARLAMTAITQLMVAYVVLGGVLILFDEPVVLRLEYIGLAMLLMMAMGFGIGTLNCVLIAFFPVWDTVWNILNRPLLLISGVIFLYDRFPEPWRGYLWWNPLIHPVGLMRKGFYPGYDAPYVSLVFPGMVAIATLAAGVLLLRRFHREMLEV